jgi:tetratricopeptide (TPR) repeat protein
LLEALHIFKKSYGTDHFNTITLQTNVLWFYNRRMQYEKAINFINENSEAIMASDKFEKIISFNRRMGQTYTKTKQLDRAAQIYLQTLELAHNNKVTDRDLIEKLYVGYADSLIEQQNYSMAQEQLDKALKHSKDRVPEFIPYQLKVIKKMAELDFKKGGFDAAKNKYLKIVAHTESSRLYNL